jgi:predicted nucleic acid-binding protein
MVPPENLKIDCVPGEYPGDRADSAQPSHRQISGRCRCRMDLVYHGWWLATCLPAVQDDFAHQMSRLTRDSRSLDAIHLGTALHARGTLTSFVTYDKRLLDAAVAASLPVDSPA